MGANLKGKLMKERFESLNWRRRKKKNSAIFVICHVFFSRNGIQWNFNFFLSFPILFLLELKNKQNTRKLQYIFEKSRRKSEKENEKWNWIKL